MIKDNYDCFIKLSDETTESLKDVKLHECVTLLLKHKKSKHEIKEFKIKLHTNKTSFLDWI